MEAREAPMTRPQLLFGCALEQDRLSAQERTWSTRAMGRLSTVLAQDHFYSDFLSLQVTNQKPFVTVMMMESCSTTGKYVSGSPCRFEDHWSSGIQSS